MDGSDRHRFLYAQVHTLGMVAEIGRILRRLKKSLEARTGDSQIRRYELGTASRAGGSACQADDYGSLSSDFRCAKSGSASRPPTDTPYGCSIRREGEYDPTMLTHARPGVREGNAFQSCWFRDAVQNYKDAISEELARRSGTELFAALSSGKLSAEEVERRFAEARSGKLKYQALRASFYAAYVRYLT